MLLPMSPTSSMFLVAESREHPMHVGGLELFRPPEGADASDIRRMFDETMADSESRDLDEAVAPLFLKRPRRTVTTLGQWGWERDAAFDLEHHVRRSALPQPGRVRELLELVSRLHSTLLDRHRPLWETHLIEGLSDGRFAVYTKTHHSLVDGVSALRMLSRMMSEDPDRRGMPAPWAPKQRSGSKSVQKSGSGPSLPALFGEAAGVGPSLLKTLNRARLEQAAPISFSSPRSMFNVKITGARRFAAQSWPIERFRTIGKATDTTVNDVFLAVCSGALRRYMLDMDALPDTSLTAMVPVSLHSDSSSADGGGNDIGMTICRLGTDLDDPGARLASVHRSMQEAKDSMSGLSHLQILLLSGLGISPLAVWPALGLVDTVRPPFNLVISNVPGPKQQLFWNGAQLDGLWPLSIPLDGQALNITCTSYADEIGFGLVGCRRTVPHLQRLLTHIDEELQALEKVAGV